MQHSMPTAGTRKRSAILPALTLTFVLTASTPGLGNGGNGREDHANLTGLVREFNSICSDLQKARCDLQMQLLDEVGFGDRILDLFVRADSITTLLDQWIPGPAREGQAFALEWALKYLRASLRENFEGIVERNGYRFVTADLAFKAAEAWRGTLIQRPISMP